MKKSVFFWLFLFSISFFQQGAELFANNKSAQVSVHVELNPVGSFDLKSDQVIGKGTKSGSEFSAKELKVPVTSLKSGISLRDKHTHEKLQADKYPFIIVTDIVAKGEKSGEGTAKIKVRNITKPIEFTYKVDSPESATATFELDISDFSFEGISYKGVGVEDVVQINATIPYSSGTEASKSTAPKKPDQKPGATKSATDKKKSK